MTFDTQKPRFAYELEHLIFTQAASESVYCATNLMQVAKRVHGWVAPILYRVVVLDAREIVWPPINAFTPPSGQGLIETMTKYGKHLRHFLISGAVSNNALAECLKLCPNIVDLALWDRTVHPDVIRVCANLKLKRLSVNVGNGLDYVDWTKKAKGPPGDKVDVTLWQSSLTHLEVIDQDVDLEGWKPAFHGLKNLQYVSMQASELEDDDDLRSGVLKACKGLKGLAFIAPMYKYFDEDADEEEEEADKRDWRVGNPWDWEVNLFELVTSRLFNSVYSDEDRRLLIVFSKYTEDWLKGSLIDEGMWSLAEKKASENERK
ncbi:hypothetical protein BDN72DRAFT_846154 [Pluteus cervinus]|uniref:Uncharacterized protein n=1 Tax=Pluteus cervinus TaxID=181527 RepID=A0ACD3AHJ3_9AGAR|nr:hypothetical protein BDN72DRAFT_846154 [Pluteus cervinus]